ncbi:MAG TPA: efflux RND transporter permease subunit [Polyangiaceae bacterium LLY-WYZ-15_(1-7)]|nr:acriflavine resistance protein B [Myxococcales bacterium]MAT26615.1 acriflavine resistance protein B [Sandaracinus sp.]HJK90595.1 efflux RND transporter permease subunit [Polyangiaceae bacterium LLY-WYZ-15_(1-7)]MBJ73137.1 acriflavine resistance protein B [Sandaracinus sp.]HJL05147.1 efflux RND transporter permease subunit [Polyangiaceae bacterium LLY-WYZ-15_(1-7)]
MSDVTAAAIRRNRVTFVVLGVLLIAGVQAYLQLPQKMDPGFTIRTAQVVTRFPGASPDRVEQLVTDPIEQVVQEIPELDFVSSTSRTGVSVVSVNIREEFEEMRPIWDDLRRKIDSVRPQLPAGAGRPDVNDELGDIYPMLFSMIADEGFSDRELREIAETIRDELLHVDGVAKVEILGEQEERVFVEYSSARLAQLGLSPGQLQQILQTRNIIQPGGQIDFGPETLVLQPSGNFVSVEELGETIVQLPDGSLTSLSDITTIRRGYVDPPQGLVRAEGHRALTFAVSMSDGHNLVELGARVRAFFDELPRDYPHGIDFEIAYFQPEEVEQKVDQFIENVLQAVGIVLAVMLLTLGLRTGLVVSTLIPSAMIITLWVMGLVGETLNQMSLASLIIALGLLVDNAIVVSELILVRMRQGEAPFDAAVASVKELRTPLLVSSLTTAAAFLPIYLAESAVGEYTGALFTVVSITLLVSWGLAITVIPLLCTLFLKVKEGEEEDYDTPFYRLYRATLRVVLRRRWISLGVVIAAFVGSLQLWQLVPEIFFPSQERAFFMAELSLPPGTNIEATRRMSRSVDTFLREELMVEDAAGEAEDAEGVVSWTSFLGETPPPFTLGYMPSPSQGGYLEMMVRTSSEEANAEAMDRLRRWAVDAFPDVKTYIRALSSGPAVTKPVQVRISGPDTEQIFALVDRVKAELGDIEGVTNIGDDWGARVKKLVVEVDEQRARRAGVTNQDVAYALQTFLDGLEATRYREEDESIPVMLRSIAADRRDLDRVRTLAVFSQRTGRSVPLGQVAEIELEWEPAAVLRRDRYRTVTVEADVQEGTTAIAIFERLRPWLEAESEEWPVGYRWEYGGEYESSVEANRSIGEKLPIAGLVIVLLLVWQFNSIRKPLIVLSSIVLAMIGVVVGLVVMGSSFGFMTLLGVVSLAGIVINNAIVLIDRIQIEQDENGLEPAKAIVAAAQQRVRPILLTTATTVASLIPLYLSGGAMWEPMAVAIMFGLVFSTMLTLLAVPLLYAMFFRVDRPRAGTQPVQPEGA